LKSLKENTIRKLTYTAVGKQNTNLNVKKKITFGVLTSSIRQWWLKPLLPDKSLCKAGLPTEKYKKEKLENA
jgi:hypothetical protein